MKIIFRRFMFDYPFYWQLSRVLRYLCLAPVYVRRFIARLVNSYRLFCNILKRSKQSGVLERCYALTANGSVSANYESMAASMKVANRAKSRNIR